MVGGLKAEVEGAEVAVVLEPRRRGFGCVGVQWRRSGSGDLGAKLG